MYEQSNKGRGYGEHFTCTMTDPIMVVAKCVLWTAGYLDQS